MTTLTINLPDNLAKEAQDAGLLAPDAIETLLREAVQRKAVDELFDAMASMAEVDEPPAMSPEEVAEEVRAMRAERRAKNTR